MQRRPNKREIRIICRASASGLQGFKSVLWKIVKEMGKKCYLTTKAHLIRTTGTTEKAMRALRR